VVEIMAVDDKSDGVCYCMSICIHRRPKATLPESQYPRADSRYDPERLYNEIDNGNDVSDEEWRKVFGPETRLDPRTGEEKPIKPGETYKKYKEKLAALRAKKKDELKAPPPEKKEK
jgi:hypothetical protein